MAKPKWLTWIFVIFILSSLAAVNSPNANSLKDFAQAPLKGADSTGPSGSLLDDNSLANGYEQTVSEESYFLFVLSGERYILRIDKIEEGNASLILSGNPITLKIGDKKTLDINNDHINDLLIALRNITADRQIDLFIQKILPVNKKITKNITLNESVFKATEQTNFSNVTKSSANNPEKSGTLISLAAILITGAVVLAIVYKRKKKALIKI
jgi:hypothetical protein